MHVLHRYSKLRSWGLHVSACHTDPIISHVGLKVVCEMQRVGRPALATDGETELSRGGNKGGRGRSVGEICRGLLAGDWTQTTADTR